MITSKLAQQGSMCQAQSTEKRNRLSRTDHTLPDKWSDIVTPFLLPAGVALSRVPKQIDEKTFTTGVRHRHIQQGNR